MTCGGPTADSARLTLNHRPIASRQILAVEIPAIDSANAGGVDYYRRGVDVVGIYSPTDTWPFRTQIYWRAQLSGAVPGLATIELMVSVQTDLLDSQPRVLAGSSLVGNEARQLVDPAEGRFEAWQPKNGSDLQRSAPHKCSCTLMRLPDGTGSFVELVHPVDFGRTELTRLGPAEAGNASLWSLKHPLFAEALEKGVILRARLLAAFVGPENDEAQAAALYREFADSEPPLTT